MALWPACRPHVECSLVGQPKSLPYVEDSPGRPAVNYPAAGIQDISGINKDRAIQNSTQQFRRD